MLSIPGIGTSLKNVGCIAIDRKDGIHSIKKVEEQSKKILENDDRHILIFPQGTRVPVDSNTNDYPYKGGWNLLNPRCSLHTWDNLHHPKFPHKLVCYP